jgi:hypothetical protein
MHGTLRIFFIALYFVAVVLGWTVARRDPRHRWIAGFITWMLAVELGRKQLEPMLDVEAVRALARILSLSWTFLFLGCCLHYFVGRRPDPALAAWGTASLFVANVSAVSGEALTWIYDSTGLAGGVISWACILWGFFRRIDLTPTLAHLTLIFYAASDIVVYVVPARAGLAANWPVVLLSSNLAMLAIVVSHAVWLLRSPVRRS